MTRPLPRNFWYLLWPFLINLPAFYVIFTLWSAAAVDEFMADHGGPSHAPWSAGLAIGVLMTSGMFTVLITWVFQLWKRIERLESALASFRDVTSKGASESVAH